MNQYTSRTPGNGHPLPPRPAGSSPGSSESLGDLLPRLAYETIDLAKTELLRFKLEASTRAKNAAKAGATIAGLALFGLLTLLVVIVASILSLGAALDSYGGAAFIVAGVLAVICGICFVMMRSALKQVTNPRMMPDGRQMLETPASRTLAAEVGHARSDSAHHGVSKQQALKEKNLE